MKMPREMFLINGNSAWKAQLGKHLNFSTAQFDLKVVAICLHMIFFKLGMLIRHRLRGAKSGPGLCSAMAQSLHLTACCLAVTKPQSLVSVCTLSTIHKKTIHSFESTDKTKHSLVKLVLSKSFRPHIYRQCATSVLQSIGNVRLKIKNI